MEVILGILLSPEFRSLILAISVLVSIPSAIVTWFAWAKTKRRTILGISVFFTGWAFSASFFGIRYALGETAFSPAWFVVPNLASLGMSAGAFIYLRSILSVDVRADAH